MFTSLFGQRRKPLVFTGQRRPRGWRLNIVRLEDRVVPTIFDWNAIRSTYNDGVNAVSAITGALAQQKFGLDLPVVADTLNSVLDLAGKLQTPFNTTFDVNATLQTVSANLTAAGFTVERLSTEKDSSGDLVRLSKTFHWSNAGAQLDVGGKTGFTYFDNGVNGELNGKIQAKATTITLPVTFGVDVRPDNSLAFFISDLTNLHVDGFAGEGQVSGAMAIRWLADVQATAQLSVDLDADLTFTDSDGDHKIRISEVFGSSVGVINGAVNLAGSMRANLPILPDLNWTGSFTAPITNSVVTPSFALTEPDANSVLLELARGLFEANNGYDESGGVGQLLAQNLETIGSTVFNELGIDDELDWLLETVGTATVTLSNINQVLEDNDIKANINSDSLKKVINGERVSLLSFHKAGGKTWDDPSSWTIGSIPLPFGIPAAINASVFVAPYARLAYDVGLGIDTTGFYIDPNTHIRIEGGVRGGIEASLQVLGFLNLAELRVGTSFSISAGIGLSDPDPTDGRIYLDEIFRDSGNVGLAQSFLNVMTVDLVGEARGFAEAVLTLPWPLPDITIMDREFSLGRFWDVHRQPTLAKSLRVRPLVSHNEKTWSVIDGTLMLDAAETNLDHESVYLSQDNGLVVVNWPGYGEGRIAGVQRVSFIGGAGNDRLRATDDFSLPITADGGPGNDHIIGGAGNDLLLGGDGDDVMQGGSGNDTIHGGTGVDTIVGGLGADILRGDADDDNIRGGLDNDSIWGGGGNDVLEGEGGADLIFGEAGVDELRGGSGNDWLDGGGDGLPETIKYKYFVTDPAATATQITGKWECGQKVVFAGDHVYGDEGNDTLLAGNGGGANYLFGGSGNDSITGDVGDDFLMGADGLDILFGMAGNDSMDGGAGNDLLEGGDGDDLIDGDAGNDLIRGDDTTVLFTGNDTLRGGAGVDQLYGGRGNDRLNGGADADFVSGEAGCDVLEVDLDTAGTHVTDQLSGGIDQDTFMMMGNDYADEIKLYYGSAEVESLSNSTSLEIGMQFPSGKSAYRISRRWTSGGTMATKLSNFSFDLLPDVEQVAIGGGKGNDTLSVDISVPRNIQLFGGEGNDVLIGGAKRDTLVGGLGNDTLDGMAGDDVLYGDEINQDKSGGHDTLYGGSGNDNIYGQGGNDRLFGVSGFDYLDGGNDNDEIRAGTGLLGCIMSGGAGNDTMFGAAGIDVIRGDDGDDLLRGGDFGDCMMGGADNDTLYGENGRDTMFGDSGNDVIWASDETGITNAIVTDWTAYALMIDAQADQLDAIIFANDKLLQDPNLPTHIRSQIEAEDPLMQTTASALRLMQAQLYPKGMIFRDELLGGEGNDSLHGSDLFDVAFGENGNDNIYFSPGSDTNDGGLGEDDALWIDGTPGHDSIVITASGPNSALASVNDKPAAEVVQLNIESIGVRGLAGNDTFTASMGSWASKKVKFEGGDNDDLIIATESPTPIYAIGGTGDDTIKGGKSDDELYGENGNDLIYGGIGNDLLFGDDKDSGTDGNDIIWGEGGNDWIRGGNGNDELYGGTENDTIHGERDELVGTGSGIDLIYGEEGDDLLIDSTSDANVLQGGAGNDVLLVRPSAQNAINWLYGGANNDTITINAGVPAMLYGDDGDDVLTGGSGSDSIFGGGGNDTLKGMDGPDWIDGQTNNDTIEGNLGDDVLIGGEGNDTITGNDGNDWLYGKADYDLMYGGNGLDYLAGDDGNDTLYGEAGNDTIDGGWGNDSIFGAAGDDTLNGDGDNDTMLGGVGNDVMYGGSGADGMNGEDGTDNLWGDADNDSLWGGNHNDRVEGGNGANVIRGEEGDDTLVSTQGASDTILGGNGNDNINSLQSTSIDIYAENGNDTIQAGGDYSNFIRVYGGDGNDAIYRGASNNICNAYFYGGSGDDLIYGGRGNDKLYGDSGTDSIHGGDGADIIGGNSEGSQAMDNCVDQLWGDAGGDRFVNQWVFHPFILEDTMVDYNTGAGDLWWHYW